MKRTIEIELRYEIETSNFDLALKPIKQSQIIDIYYDVNDGNFYKKGVFIRKRNNKKLDFKFNLEDFINTDNPNDHTHCDEYSFEIPFAKNQLPNMKEVCSILELDLPLEFSFNGFLKTNDLLSFIKVDKQRTISKDNDYIISIDEVKGLGKFLEIERDVEIDKDNEDYQQRFNKIKKEIDDYANQLASQSNFQIKRNHTGYCELILRESNFELYKQGKYVLDEDK
jgi:predicted adenylyl cyclase CyaB